MMFKNIISQNNALNFLKNDILKDFLANSMIFYGENSNGKLTTAIETARILNCKLNKDSDCRCQNCIKFENFNYKGLIILSRRNFYYLVNAYIESYNLINDSIYIDRICKVIKLLFNSSQDFILSDILNENEKKQMSAIFDFFTDFLNKKKYIQSDFNKLLLNIDNLNKIYKMQNIPVDSIRAVINWSYILQKDTKKVIIIDHFDLLEKSSQNILLKRIEEPSEDLFFILISENINKIIPTIKSRCRRYFFIKNSENDIKIILKKQFGLLDSSYSSIKHFLLNKDEISYEIIIQKIHKLLNLTFNTDAAFSDLNLFLDSLKEKKVIKAIINELLILIDKEIIYRFRNFHDNEEFKILRKLSNINILNLKTILKEISKQLDVFNLNPLLLIEGIFYPLKAMVYNDKI